MAKGRSKCRHGDVCAYGTSEYLPLLNGGGGCWHSTVHRQDVTCPRGDSHLCWARYLHNEDQLMAKCQDIKTIWSNR